MLRRNGNSVVHFLTQGANLLRLARKSFLAPDTGNSSRNRHKVGWRGQKDLFIECKVPQLRFMLKRRREEMLTGDKHDHIIRGLGKLVPIGLARQALDMVFHRLRMARHGNGTYIIVDGVKRVLIIV